VLGELLRGQDEFRLHLGRLIRVEADLLERVPVVVHDRRRALEGDGPDLAALRRVQHESGEEVVHPDLCGVPRDQLVQRDDDVLAEDVIQVLGQHDGHVRGRPSADRGQRLRIGLGIRAGEHRLDLDLRVLLVPFLDVPVDDPGERPGHADRVVELEPHLRVDCGRESSNDREYGSGEHHAELHGTPPLLRILSSGRSESTG
jgi:hypothetical protein